MSNAKLLERVLDFLSAIHRKGGLDESMLDDLRKLTVEVHIAVHNQKRGNL